MEIQAILFDAIGTTIIERDQDVVNRCFQDAFSDHAIEVDGELIRHSRGRNKRDAINDILIAKGKPLYLNEKIYATFVARFESNLHFFEQAENLHELMKELKLRRIILGVGTGLPNSLFSKIFYRLGWNKLGWDFVATADDVKRGRPHPDMVFEMMKMFSIPPSGFLKVGDTVSDILEGKNAGVFTCAILSGTTHEADIVGHSPDHVIRSLTEILSLVRY